MFPRRRMRSRGRRRRKEIVGVFVNVVDERGFQIRKSSRVARLLPMNVAYRTRKSSTSSLTSCSWVLYIMALPLPPGLTPPETAFLCEMEMVTVIPRQRLEGLELLAVS